MTISGRIQNGVVVPDSDLKLPEGSIVTIVTPADAAPPESRMPDDQKRRQREAFARLDALPDENPGDTFNGAEHDSVLYGPWRDRLMP